jgi:hypothetical protein
MERFFLKAGAFLLALTERETPLPLVCNEGESGFKIKFSETK